MCTSHEEWGGDEYVHHLPVIFGRKGFEKMILFILHFCLAIGLGLDTQYILKHIWIRCLPSQLDVLYAFLLAQGKAQLTFSKIRCRFLILLT